MMETIKTKAKGLSRKAKVRAGLLATSAMVSVGSVSAQSYCSTDFVTTLNNIGDAVLSIAPVLGMISAMVSLVMMGQVSSKDKKKKWKQRRNDAFLYGVAGVLMTGAVVNLLTSFLSTGNTSCISSMGWV